MAADNTALKTDLLTGLSGLTLNQSKIQKRGIPLDELVVLKIDGQKYGPLWINDLDPMVLANPADFQDTKIRTFGEKKWQILFDFKHYNRRSEKKAAKKSLPPAIDQGKSYIILGPSKNQGPMSGQEVLEKLEAGDALVTDMISDNGGTTWSPLHQRNEFLFAAKGQGALPGTPDTGIFELSELEAKESLKSTKTGIDEKEAIAGLAYIGHLTKTNAQERDYSETVQIFKGPWFKQWRWRFLLGSVVFSVFMAGLFWSSDQDKSIKFSDKAQRDLAARPAPAPRRRVQPTLPAQKNSTKSAKVKKARVTPRPTVRALPVPKARKPNQPPPERRPSYQDRKNLDDDPLLKDDQQDDYYYDDVDPVQQDPARKKLSKKTIDPDYADPDQDYDQRIDPEMVDPPHSDEPIRGAPPGRNSQDEY